MARQAWNRKEEPDRDVLKRIVALLLALAALVDRAAGLPAASRPHVLAILGHGEAEVRSLIVAMASDRCPAPPAEATAAPPPAAGDAALLAARFRVLALMVGAVLAQVDPRPSCRHASPPALLPGCRPQRPQGWRAVPAPPPLDTS